MNRRSFYNRVKGREVAPFFEKLQTQIKSIDMQMKKAAENSAAIHDRLILKAILSSTINLYNKGVFPSGETVNEYKQRDRENCNRALDKIFLGVEEYELKIDQ